MHNSVKNRDQFVRKLKGNPNKIMIKENGKYFFLDNTEINRIESHGNYIKVFTSKGHHLMRETMKNIEKKLDQKLFFRIHRSTIINIGEIKFIEPWFHGDYHVITKNGERFTMSRNYTRLLEIF